MEQALSQPSMKMEVASWTDGRMIFPDQTKTLKHVDYEPNGRLDATQPAVMYQILDRPTRRAARGLMSGVHFLRTMNPYYVDESKNPVFTTDFRGADSATPQNIGA